MAATKAGMWGQKAPGLRCTLLLAALCLVLAFVGPTSADADESGAPSITPSPQTYEEAINKDSASQVREAESELTNLGAAEELPHTSLDRTEALELLRKTFGTQLQEPAGIFAELEVQKFLSNNVAVIAAGSQPEPAGIIVGGKDEVEEQDQPTLLDSTIPLRTSSETGDEEVVDLNLEHSEGELQPANPLIEVGIPIELGEGIELPNSGVTIKLASAPEERVPSTVEQSVAVYPNVAQDTDFAVAPTPNGVETLTQIRSADAPRSQTLNLGLPSGASLVEGEDGGAEVVRNGETLVKVEPPTAMDASGSSVPVSFEVAGNSLTFTASPGPDAAYPILVDPLLDEYVWGSGTYTHMSDWKAEHNSTSPWVQATSAQCSTWCQGYLAPNSPGLWVAAWNGGPNAYGNEAGWHYQMPRWQEDWEHGYPITTYISEANYFAISFQHRNDLNASPYLIGGLLWPEKPEFTTSFTRAGNQPNLSLDSQPYIMMGSKNSKEATWDLFSLDSHQLSDIRDAWLGWATVELTDPDHPKPGESADPTQWVNKSPTAVLPFQFTDKGLGVSSITVSDKSGHSWTTSFGCIGIASNPCPRSWTSSTTGQPKLTYDPSVLPQGTTTLNVVASDPIGHHSDQVVGEEKAMPTNIQLKVDHAAPSVELSGTMTEQATLGTTRPQYTLEALAQDGATASPQSGVASMEIKVDGKVVNSATPGCPEKNCELAREFTLVSSAYSVGSHTVVVKAKDAVGITTEKTLAINIAKDTTAPQLTATSTFFTAPEGWLEQKAYSYVATGSDPNGSGMKAIVLKIDGKTISSVTQSCPTGACKLSLSKSINMAEYSGGAHWAELIATDGAGNATTKAWTINVDPKGNISSGEATDTLEAVEETAPATTVVAPTAEVISPEERAEGNNPGLVQEGEELTSVGTPVESSIGLNPEGGISIDMPDEPDLKLQPVSTATSATSSEVVSGAAAVAGNTATSVDTIVRPQFNGDMSFQSIRDASGPESFSWEMSLAGGRTAKAIDSEDVGIYREDGSQAALIGTEFAHDALGKAVPTSLSVSGNVITLTIHHRGGGFTYPIVGGPSFEVGYTAVVDLNPSEILNPEEEEGIEVEAAAPRPVPIPDPEPEAGASTARHTHVAEYKMRKCQTYVCAVGFWEAHLEEAYLFNGTPHVTGGQAWHDSEVSYHHCNNTSATQPWSISVNECIWIGNHAHYYRENAHYMCAQSVFHANDHLSSEYHAMTFHNFGDGYAKPHQNSTCQVFVN